MNNSNIEDIIHIENIINNKNRISENYLYEKYKKYIRNFIVKNYGLKNNEDIEDIVSEILIKIFSSMNKYNPDKSKFSTWVINITKNHMIDKFRYKNNNSTIFNVNEINYFFKENNKQHDSEFEDKNAVSYLLNELEERDCKYFTMFSEGYTYNEIGDVFNQSSVTVCNRVNYIKAKLKKEDKFKNEVFY